MDKTARGLRVAGPEVRTYPARFEVRTLPGSKVELNGYASTTEQPYQMWDMFGSYQEVVRAGAFAKTLSEGADVAFLVNHEGLTMARTKNGTLRLAEDTTGLHTTATVNVARSDARDLVTAIEDGDVDEMSFAFTVMRQQWSPDYDERALVELNIDKGDVSAVNYGANPSTTVGVTRAFRRQTPARLHRLAVELREGKVLSASNAALLAQALDALAQADDAFDPLRTVVDGTDEALDTAQQAISSVLGVPDPDTDEPDEMDGQRALAAALVMHRTQSAAAPRLAVGF